MTLNENEINTNNNIASSPVSSTTDANANAKSDKQNIGEDGMSYSEKNNPNVQSSQHKNLPLSLHNIIESESGSTKQVIASA